MRKTKSYAAHLPRKVRAKLIEISAETDPEFSYVVGRNGSAYITRLRVRESYAGPHVYITGIGKRGKEIRGGFMVTKECFEEVSRQYLNAARGYVIEARAPSRDAGEEGFVSCVSRRETRAVPFTADREIVLPEVSNNRHPAVFRLFAGRVLCLLDLPVGRPGGRWPGDGRQRRGLRDQRRRILHDPPESPPARDRGRDGSPRRRQASPRNGPCAARSAVATKKSKSRPRVWVKLTAEGTDVFDVRDGSHEWNNESPAQCRRCDFSGTVGDFQLADDESRSTGRTEGNR